MHRALRNTIAAIGSVTEELFVALALVLIAVGCWSVCRPAAFIVPGVVLLWLFVPQRQRFVAPRPPLVTRRKDAA